MQVGVRFPAAVVLSALLLVTPGVRPVLAGIEEQGSAYVVNYFTDADGISVITHQGSYGLELENSATIDVEWSRDTVVVPAIDAAPGSQDAVDAITSASRPIAGSADAYDDFVKTRNVGQVSAAHHGFNATYYVSTESDYFAQMASVGHNRDFLGDNLNLAGSFSYGWDRIEPLVDDDTAGTSDRQRRQHWSLVATQTLTPTTVLRLGGELDHTRGLQHDPYRNVLVDGIYVAENHPETRNRHDVFVQLRQYLMNRSSVRLDYKYYGDDWGVVSHAIGAKLHQYVGRDVIVRYRYRFYSQGAADFWQNEYTDARGVNGYQTADYRLEDFTAHLFGTKVSWNLGRGPLAIAALDGLRVNVKYERYFNSNNFSANIFESGVSLSF